MHKPTEIFIKNQRRASSNLTEQGFVNTLVCTSLQKYALKQEEGIRKPSKGGQQTTKQSKGLSTHWCMHKPKKICVKTNGGHHTTSREPRLPLGPMSMPCQEFGTVPPKRGARGVPVRQPRRGSPVSERASEHRSLLPPSMPMQ